MGNGSVSTYQAYDNLKILSTRLDIARSNIKKNTVPSELTDEHKKQLNSSLEQLSTWIYYRQKACDDMKDLIDENNFKPSALDKIKNTVQSGDSQMMSALVKITSVQNDLGLLEKK